MDNVAAYARVSTEEQALESFPLATQPHANAKWSYRRRE